MITTVLANIFRFVVLILLQVLVLDHMDLSNGWVVPYLYVLFILMLPFETPSWAVLLIGFGTGLVMDLFTSTPGMHTSATTILAFGRNMMLRVLAPRDGYEFGKRPTIRDMGLNWFITYAGVLVLLHHLWLFFVEVYRWSDAGTTFVRAMVSAAATLVLCLLAQALTSSGPRTR